MMKILSVAWLEIVKSRSVVDRRIIISLFLISLVPVLTVPHMDLSTFSMDKDLYRASVDGQPLDVIVRSDERFKLVNEDPDLIITGNNIGYGWKERSRAALAALDGAVRQYKNTLLKSQYQPHDPAYYSAFPVWVDVIYLDLSLTVVDSTGGVITDSQQNPNQGSATATDTPQPGAVPDPVDSVQGIPPGEISPPFPLTSVLISFIFVAPMFFISQLYSSSIMDERVSRKGVMLLASPLRGYEIVAGKTLPYFLSLLLFTSVAAVLSGGGVLIVLSMVPVMLIFLSTAFISSILAKNFRELTIMLVLFSVVLGSYLFIPAAFINIHEYSTISPLTIAVLLLEGGTVTAKAVAFASIPLLFASLLAYLFGTLLMNEEGLFVKVEAFEKILDSVERLMYYLGNWRLGVLTIGILMVPFVFCIQLFLLVIFFNVMNISPYLVIAIGMAVSVYIEEWAKALAPSVLIRKKCRSVLLMGFISGMGYFLGEKGLLLLALASVVEGGLGQVLFTGAGQLLVIPLAVHVTGALITSAGMGRGIPPGRAVLLASAVHFMLNLVIIRWGGVFG